MELVLLNFVALLRPLASLRYVESYFDILGVGIFAMAVVAMLVTIALRKSLTLSAIDWLILAFTIWCLAIYVIYFESARIAEVTKLIVPMLTYTLVKNVIKTERQFWRLVFWMIVGFSIPVVASAVLIVTGDHQAIQYVSYWTDLPRWQGAYENSHNLGHSMTLLLMTLALYYHFGRYGKQEATTDIQTLKIVPIIILSAVALYCLYMSQVRTALLGILIFGGIFYYSQNKRLLLIAGGSLALVALATVTYWLPALVPESSMLQRGIELDILDLGSGRGRFWLNDIHVYAGLSIDQQLAGVGIGARGQQLQDGDILYGHSDWLEILTQTGLVGFGLFMALQILILRRIMRIDGKQRYGFLAMFLAVSFMMVSSNSYAWRIQVSQLYFMLLAFIEIRNAQTHVERADYTEKSQATQARN